MDSETIDAVTDWETVAVEDGYRGLHDLADDGFTGAVTDGRAWAFALNGRVVGVFDGAVAAFEGADLTAYEAPDPALPLLYAMRERGGETQAKYYTKEMSLSEADETLRSGSFTGYVRLSENVLSGDYYVVYYGGKSMSVAFVGNSRRLVTGDEAFERADDEVGIYEVIDADVDVVELPDAPEPDPDAADTDPDAPKRSTPDDAGTDATDGAEAGPDAADERDRTPTDATGETAPGPDSTGPDTPTANAPERAASSPADGSAADADPAPAPDASDASAAETATGDESTADPAGTEGDDSARAETDDDAAPEAEASADPSRGADAGDAPAAGPTRADAARPRPERTRERTDAETAAAGEAGERDDDVFSEEAEWREARAIPSLDPTETEADSEAAARGRADAEAETETETRTGDAPTERRRPPSPPQSVSRSQPEVTVESESEQRSAPGSSAASASRSAPTDDAADLRERLAEATAARERLEAKLDELESARDEIAAERDEYRERAERLESRVADLEAEVADLESQLAEASAGDSPDADTDADPGRTMSAGEALAGTNLFVRYESKADPTLSDAHAGNAGRDEVNDNLRVEHHTQFDTDGLRVEGKPFEEFLRDTVEYRFVDWVVRSLPYDVRATRAQSELQDLYDAIPRIDRVELDGTVSVPADGADAESEDAAGEEESFDVVLWDGRGDPLVVADLNTSRDPATESMVTSLVSDATAVGEAHDSLGAAFYVTASYFEPGALDAVGDATGGGLLSRGKRKSFVRLARKQGFHLCLVEARNREFHVSVPDL